MDFKSSSPGWQRAAISPIGSDFNSSWQIAKSASAYLFPPNLVMLRILEPVLPGLSIPVLVVSRSVLAAEFLGAQQICDASLQVFNKP